MIRQARPADRAALLELVVELQEAERPLDPLLLPGAEMAESYLAQVEADVARWGGAILVAEADGRVVGMTSVYFGVPSEGADQAPGTFALVNDLAVRPDARGRGVGARLLRGAAEAARRHGAEDLRVQVLAGNVAAERLYARAGFRPYLVTWRCSLPAG